MPKAPDLKVLENYAGYKRISNVNELIKESKEQDNLALHFAAWRGLGYYHHYILFIISVSENIINITIIEKSNKNCSKLVPASAFGNFGSPQVNQPVIDRCSSSASKKVDSRNNASQF